MKFDVRYIRFSDYREITIKDNGITIDSGFLSHKGAIMLATGMIDAAIDLLYGTDIVEELSDELSEISNKLSKY